MYYSHYYSIWLFQGYSKSFAKAAHRFVPIVPQVKSQFFPTLGQVKVPMGQDQGQGQGPRYQYEAKRDLDQQMI